VSTARVLAVRAALLGIVVLAGGGCFRPKILSGGFKCDVTPGAKACPDDFVCVSGLCVTPAHDGGVDAPKGGSGGGAGSGGKGGSGGGGGEKVDAQPDVPCLPAVANTNCPELPNNPGTCDPVCNTGCPDSCHDKCSVNSKGALTCNRLIPAPSVATPKGILANCTQNSGGADAAGQTDNCVAGTVCLALECPSPRCYQFCRSAADCANGATCSRDAGGGHSFCDVPPTVCNPVNPQVDSGCPPQILAEACYLSSKNMMQTVCDCEYVPSQGGGHGRGDDCTLSRQCGIGLACYDAVGSGQPKCVQVCRLPSDGGVNNGCNGGPCSPFSTTSSIYGFCP
jgi:hypothetical protein